MSVLGTIALAFSCLIKFSTETAFMILKANYYLMTAFINFVNFVVTSVTNSVHLALFVLQCYVTDFLLFVNEVVIGLKFVLHLLSSIIIGIFESLSILKHALYSSILAFIMTIMHAISIVGEYLLYFISLLKCAMNLTFSAVILILQFLPNCFLLAYYAILKCTSCVAYSLNALFLQIFNVSYFICSSVKASSLVLMHSIPPKAFVGLVIIILIYYKYKPIAHYTKYSIKFIFYIFMFSFFKILSYVHRILSVFCSCILSPIYWFRHFPDEYDSAATREYVQPEHSDHSAIPSGSRSCVTNLQRKFNIKINDYKNLSDSEENISLRDLQLKLNEEKDKQLCIICQDQQRTVLLLPCRHLCLCNDCCTSLLRSHGPCPVCRKYILDRMQVFV